jgi:hypothetical protein
MKRDACRRATTPFGAEAFEHARLHHVREGQVSTAASGAALMAATCGCARHPSHNTRSKEHYAMKKLLIALAAGTFAAGAWAQGAAPAPATPAPDKPAATKKVATAKNAPKTISVKEQLKKKKKSKTSAKHAPSASAKAPAADSKPAN